MPLGVNITRVLPIYPNAVFVQWDLTGVTESGSYVVDVYRGGSQNGPWEAIALGRYDTYNYLDRLPTAVNNDPNLLSLMRGIFYKIVVTPPSGVVNQAYAYSSIEPKLDGRFKLLKRKILRDESVMLRKLNGVEVAVLKRMKWGPRCTQCYDKYTRQSTRGNCTTCYGTTFMPGYHTPIITLARRGTIPKSKHLTPQGDMELEMTRVMLLDAPKVSPDDVLVFLRDNRRFLVKEVMATELKTVTVHQSLSVVELARSSVEYRIKVDSDRIPPLF